MTKLNANEILLYLGHRGSDIPEELAQQIEYCRKKVEHAAAPRLVYRRVTLTDGTTAAFQLDGKDIKELLRPCREAVFCAVTLGSDLEKLLARQEITNMADALIMDACASTAVENVIQNFEDDLRRQVQNQGMYLTDRYSPGYGDLPLECQANWCRVLDAGRRIGLHVTSDHIMIPRKSVTAVMGIAKEQVKAGKKGCEVCSMFETCSFRKKGTACHE